MAFEADCSVSTVLEASRVASTVRFPVPGECLATLATRFSTTVARRQWASGGGCMLGGGKSEIRNPKSEIALGSGRGIPNS